MIMVTHQDVGMHFHGVALVHFRDQIQKMPSIPVIQINCLPVVAAIGDMIPAIADFKAQRASHAVNETVSKDRGKLERSKVKSQDVTPSIDNHDPKRLI